jgi:SOS-response transcriptional repressor LexA
MTLTRRETETLAFIKRFIARTGAAPFQKEIASELGISSRGFILRILVSLELKGFIKRTPYKISGIALSIPEPVRPQFIAEDVWSVVKGYAESHCVKPETIIAEWVRERAEHEARAVA